MTGFELHPSIKMLMMRNAICFIYVFIFMLLIFYSSHGLSRTFLFPLLHEFVVNNTVEDVLVDAHEIALNVQFEDIGCMCIVVGA